MKNEKDILAALDHLEHAGVKGVKWGQPRAAQAKETGEKSTSGEEKVTALLATVGAAAIVKNKI